MTSYYKGNNIGLNYDAANATWSFTNEPNDFIDPDSFSTADPAFDYTPPPSTDDDDQDTTCPPGYIYDETLKQCIPDPNANQQSGYQQDTGGGQDQPQATRVEFDASTPEGRKAMYEHGLEHGYFTTDTSKGGAYEFQGAKKAPFWTGVWGQFGENSEYNRYINELEKEDAKRKAAGQPPILAQAIGFFGLSKSFVDEQKPVFGDITTDYNKKIKDFETATLNTASNYDNYLKESGVGDIRENERIAAQERKAKFNLLKAQAAAEKAKLQAEKEQANLEKEQEKKREEERDKVREEYKATGQTTYSTQDTGGYVTIPNEPAAPPGEKGGGGYDKPGTSLGSSVHGSGSYTPSKPSRRQSGPKPGQYGWQR
jgi:hypothetical protein